MSRAGATAARRKAAAKVERRAAARPQREAQETLMYESTFIYQLADFAYVECEGCGQEQSLPVPDHGHVCLICGHDVARSHPRSDEYKQALLRGYAERVMQIPHLGDGIAA